MEIQVGTKPRPAVNFSGSMFVMARYTARSSTRAIQGSSAADPKTFSAEIPPAMDELTVVEPPILGDDHTDTDVVVPPPEQLPLDATQVGGLGPSSQQASPSQSIPS